jgi:phosphate starvation-inducible PhoH-like protein
VEDISFCRLTGTDVVRHRLVSRIVEAYEVFDAQDERPGPRSGPKKAERGPR